MKFYIESVFLSLLLACASETYASTSLIEGVTPLPSPIDSILDQDLHLFKKGEKLPPFVVLAETVHGSGGVLRMEFRLARYLIEQKGYRLFLPENPMTRTRPLEEYLQSCKSKVTVIADLSPFDEATQPDLDFFKWACQFNYDHPQNPIHIKGIDIYARPWESQAEIENLSARLNLDGVSDDLAQLKANCAFHAEKDWSKIDDFFKTLMQNKQLDPAQYYSCVQAANHLILKAEKKVKFAKSRYDAYELQMLLIAARAWQSNMNFAYSAPIRQWDARDSAQAQLDYLTYLQMGKKRAFIQTHILHGTRGRTTADWFGNGTPFVRHSAIWFLSKKPGVSIKNIVITSYDASGPKGQFNLPTDSQSLDFKLHSAGIFAAQVDVNASWLAKTSWYIQNENSKNRPNGVSILIGAEFDHLFFVDVSHMETKIEPWINNFIW